MEPIKVSVIIPTLNAAYTLPLLVDILRDQQQEIAEIMIIDSGSTDQTAALAAELGTVLVAIEAGSFDHGATRNLAANAAIGDFLIFMTQDALPANDETIGKLIEPLQQDMVVIAYARQVAGKGASLSDQYLRQANYPAQSLLKTAESIAGLGIQAFQNSNVCAAYRRKEFEELGQFPAPAVCNEDMIFAARAIFAGYGVYYNADALVYHTHNLNTKQLFRRYFDIGASLDLEPRIRELGYTEARGFAFLKGQLAFISEKKKYWAIPRVFCESVAKYLGYKLGERQGKIPQGLKKHLGSNRLYWQRIAADH